MSKAKAKNAKVLGNVKKEAAAKKALQSKIAKASKAYDSSKAKVAKLSEQSRKLSKALKSASSDMAKAQKALAALRRPKAVKKAKKPAVACSQDTGTEPVKALM